VTKQKWGGVFFLLQGKEVVFPEDLDKGRGNQEE